MVNYLFKLKKYKSSEILVLFEKQLFDIINFEYYKKQILENLNLKGEYKMEKIKC